MEAKGIEPSTSALRMFINTTSKTANSLEFQAFYGPRVALSISLVESWFFLRNPGILRGANCARQYHTVLRFLVRGASCGWWVSTRVHLYA